MPNSVCLTIDGVITIDLWPNNSGICNMCEQERILNHAVAWYCEPTHDEIGSISTQYTSSDGREAIVGGMCVCRECHDLHYGVASGRDKNAAGGL